MVNRGLGLLLRSDPCSIVYAVSGLLYWVCSQKRRMNQRSGELNISNMSEETIEENLPDLSPHLEDVFSLKQLETLHDYAVEAFKAGIEYANNNQKGATN